MWDEIKLRDATSQEAGRRKGAPLRQEGGTSRLDGVKDAAVQKCRAWHSDSHESPPPIHHETICRSDGQMPHIPDVSCFSFLETRFFTWTNKTNL